MPDENPDIVCKSSDEVLVLASLVVSKQQALAFDLFGGDFDFEFVLFFGFRGCLFSNHELAGLPLKRNRP